MRAGTGGRGGARRTYLLVTCAFGSHVLLFSDDALVEVFTKQLSPHLIIASDELRMLDISLGQGTTQHTHK